MRDILVGCYALAALGLLFVATLTLVSIWSMLREIRDGLMLLTRAVGKAGESGPVIAIGDELRALNGQLRQVRGQGVAAGSHPSGLFN